MQGDGVSKLTIMIPAEILLVQAKVLVRLGFGKSLKVIKPGQISPETFRGPASPLQIGLRTAFCANACAQHEVR
jgi:hypothetical protein